MGDRSSYEEGIRAEAHTRMVKEVSLMSRLGLEKNTIPFLDNCKAKPCLTTPLKNPTFVEKFA